MTTLSSPIVSLPHQGRSTIQSQRIGAEAMTLRCLDWDRDRFDVEFGLDNGTTYNSFIIQADKTALVDRVTENLKTYMEMRSPNTLIFQG